MELRVLVLPSEVVPNERRIKVMAQDVQTLREQVLGKLKLPLETGLAVCEVRGEATRPVYTLEQLQDKCKLKVLRRSTDEPDDRRARMKSAFSLISEGARLSDAPSPTRETSAADASECVGDAEDGHEVPGTTFIRYYSADGVPYYYDRMTGETQWDEPQVDHLPSPLIETAPPIAEDSDASAAGQLSATGSLTMGQAVLVTGRGEEAWEVVRVDGDRIQVQLRGEAIKKTFNANQLTCIGDRATDSGTLMSDRDSEPQQAQDPVVVPAVANSMDTQKLRILVLDSIDSEHPGKPAGFVMVAPRASLVDVREEIKEDELEVPECFSFAVDGDLVKSAQEKKVHVEHLVADGHVCIVPDDEPAMSSVEQPTGRSPSSTPANNRSVLGDNALPVLVGHLSKYVRCSVSTIYMPHQLQCYASAHTVCWRSQGQMPFSAWHQRYFRLSNGTLSYFVAPDDKVAKDSIVIDETCTVAYAGEKYKKKFCFEVSSWNSQLALCAECEQDCEQWMADIKKTVDVVKKLADNRGILRGLVDKRDSGFMKKWRQKWAVVNRTTLSFYDSPDDPARQRPPADELELLGATVDVAGKIGDHHFCFRVVPLQQEPIELSSRYKNELEEWVRVLRRNIEGTAASVVPGARQSWGVQSTAIDVAGRVGSSRWFDVQGIRPEISVDESRQRQIDGEMTSEYYICVSHCCASMSWHMSRKLQDILDLHEAISKSDPTKHEYLDKFVQLPREKRTKTLNKIELEQHCKLVQVYAEEVLKQTDSVMFLEALASFFCPTDKGFDQHCGRLTIQRRAHAPLPAQSCWCVLRTSDHSFSWSEDAKDEIRVSLKESVLITQKTLLPIATAGFELILPEQGIRLFVSSDDSYAVIQWIECLKTLVLHVFSEDEGSRLLPGNGMFAVEVVPLEPMTWLGAQTPDHTAMHIDPQYSWASCSGTSAPVRVTDQRLAALLNRQELVSLRTGNDAEDHKDDDDESDYDSHDDASDSGEDDPDDLNEYPMGSNRRLSATVDTIDKFRSNSCWNDGMAVILDTGSHAIKAGLGCDSFPSVVERSYDLETGSPLVYREHIGAMTTEAVITTDWDAVTNVWDDIFRHKLGIVPADHSFVLTEAPDMTRVSKQTMAEIMFEYFNASAITIQSAGVLALYAQGIWTGVVVDCGNRTKITPVYEGTVLPHAVMQSCFGGIDVNNALTSMLVEKHGATYSRDVNSLDMQRFKEQHAFVASDSESAASMAATTADAGAAAELVVKHRMSTGANLLFDRERFLCGEEPFTASLPNGCKGLAQGVQWSVRKCESVLRKQLFGSILLCGGTTCINGFPERLRHDTTALLQNRSLDRAVSDAPKVQVIAPHNRKYTPWLGGASLAQMDDFVERILFSADEYDERGTAAF